MPPTNGLSGHINSKPHPRSADLKTIKPFFPPPISPSTPPTEPQSIQSIITSLSLIPHIEGGYFAETDRSEDTIPSPFPTAKSSTTALAPQRPDFDPTVRNTSTSIHYYLTPSGPQGGFHRNKARTIHTLHSGRGKYVLIHANEPDLADGTKRVEVIFVGRDVAKGEKLQWIVEGGKFKASFLLPDDEEGGSEGLLISETVVPGFEYCDHDFLSETGMKELLGEDGAKELKWLLSPLAKE